MRNWLVVTHSSPICQLFIEGLNVSGVECYLRCKITLHNPSVRPIFLCRDTQFPHKYRHLSLNEFLGNTHSLKKSTLTRACRSVLSTGLAGRERSESVMKMKRVSARQDRSLICSEFQRSTFKLTMSLRLVMEFFIAAGDSAFLVILQLSTAADRLANCTTPRTYSVPLPLHCS